RPRTGDVHRGTPIPARERRRSAQGGAADRVARRPGGSSSDVKGIRKRRRRQMKVGFIGLGAMGSRMAANLQKSGCPLVVFNRTRDRGASLVSQVATWGDAPAADGVQVEVLVRM